MSNKSISNSNLLKEKWDLILIALIAILSFFLNFYAISNYGYGNDYYAAAALSMTKSFKNFFFVSFDPSGMVSVDKPPLGLWMQAISVLIFGYKGWALLLPQALASTASCIMIYILVKKYFNKISALISSFIFAITPIVVAVSRNNTIDMQLIFVLLIATWFLFKSIEKSKPKYLIVAGIFIGLGFNIKMLQAYMVVPAFVIVYLMFAKGKFSKKILTGIITVALMAAVSLSWAIVVQLYPASERPYVDSTSNNSIFDLIIGHNGAERILGRDNPGGGMGKNPMQNGNMPSPDQNDKNIGNPPDQNGSMTPPDQNDKNMGNPPDQNGNTTSPDQNDKNMGNPPNQNDNSNQPPKGGGMSDDYIGTASPVRLWITSIYGQISWLILMAVAAIVSLSKKLNLKKADMKDAAFIFWEIWFFTMFIFFSFAGFYHRYYLCMIAPSIAVLCGIGIPKMIQDFKEKSSWKQFILPAAFVATMALEINHILKYDNIPVIIKPIVFAATAVCILFLLLHYIQKNNNKLRIRIISISLFIAILTAPFYWALTPVIYVPSLVKPSAGPDIGTKDSKNINANMPGSSSLSDKDFGLQQYLISHYKEGSFAVVATRSNDVAKLIINTGLPAYAYGGFLGNDNSLTLDKLKEYVAEGKITYFLVSDEGMKMDGNSEITDYVKEHAVLIDESEYSNKFTTNIDTKHHQESLYYFENPLESSCS